MSQRRIEYMPLTQIAKAARNPKRHATQAIATSIDKFGLAEVPLVDERTGRLVAGHGRLDDLTARLTAGQPAPDGVTVGDGGEWLVPVVRGWASRNDDEAAAYLLASNRTTELGGWDEGSLNALLADLTRADMDLAEAAGWDIADLEGLLDAAPAYPDPVAAPDPFAPPADPWPPAPPGSPAVAGFNGTGPAGSPAMYHDEIPATDANWAETPDQEAAREQRIAAYVPRVPDGTAEMILVYSLDDRAEAQRLVAAAREVLGTDIKASEVVLRALRTLVAVLDERHANKPVRMAAFAKAAGASDLL